MKANIIITSASRGGHNHTANMIRSWVNNPSRVYKFEGVIPSDYHSHICTMRDGGRVFDVKANSINIIQVRDFLNWSASWVKYNINKGEAFNERIVLSAFTEWYKIAIEGFKDSQYIDNTILLQYDQFVQNEAYRRSICSLLDGDYTDSSIDYVPQEGMGSSFDGFSMQGKGSEMSVLKRYDWFNTEEGSYYLRHLKVKKYILEYYVEKFDLTAGQRKLVNETLK